MGALVVVLGVVSMILIHEGAHFVAAKAFGMKATEAFFGFGPRIWSITRGETEYGVKAIPLGGYVRIIGMNPFEEVEPEDEGRTYRENPFWKKSVVVLAGIFSHFLVAFVMFWIIAVAYGITEPSTEISAVSPVLITGAVDADEQVPEVLPGDELVSIDGLTVEELAAGGLPPLEPGAVRFVVLDRDGRRVAFETGLDVQPTPATLVGIEPGDTLLAVDGIEFERWDRFVELAHERPGVETEITYRRNGAVQMVTTTLIEREVDGRSTGFFGVSPTAVTTDKGPISAIGPASSDLWFATRESARGLYELVANFGSILGAAFGASDEILDTVRPVSVVGLAQIGQRVGGVEFWLGILAWVNVFVGLLNVVPLYPLDGGHFSVALYEKIRGRAPDVRKLMPVAAAVFIFVLMLGLLGIYFDIVNPLPIPD